jgi:hypothetical protein
MAVPEGLQSFPQNQAFAKVLEQMLLRALKDMQRSGELAAPPLKTGSGPADRLR